MLTQGNLTHVFLVIQMAVLVMHGRDRWRFGRNVLRELKRAGEVIVQSHFNEAIGF
jgi:hypothetical protein